MSKNFIFSILIIFIFFFSGFFLIHLSPTPLHLEKMERGEGVRSVIIAGQSIKVILAITEAEQVAGLSGRKSLNDNEGMLFVFDKLGSYIFWMKGMNFPIDIIWLAPSESGVGEDMKVVYIKKNATPESYLSAGKAGPETFGPSKTDGLAKYVLEVSAGFSDKNNLQVGDRVSLK